MKEQHLKLLVTAMAIAIAGLVFVEIYWLNESVHLKEQEFKRDVHKALSSSVLKLERYEALGLTSGANRSRGYSSSSALGMHDSLYEQSGKQPVQIQEETVIEQRNGEEYRRTVQTFVDEHGHIIERTLTENDVKEKHLEQTKNGLLEQVMNSFNSFYLKSAAQRIDPHFINEVVQRELQVHGIQTPFYLGILSNNKVTIKDKNVSSDLLMGSPHKMRLFPNDFFMSQDYLAIYFPREKGFLLRSLGGIIGMTSVFMFALVIVFWITFNTIVRQKKLALVKTDFINNMTHELKTPISTISLACEVLNDKSVDKSPERVTHFVNMIDEENKRLGTLVENVLQSAVLDKGGLKLKTEGLDLNQVINSSVDKMNVHIAQRGGVLNLDLKAMDAEIIGDKMHLTNVIGNLIDNAIKYSEDVEVSVSTEDRADGLMVQVKDKGIGIEKENLQKIFDKLYRVPKGNVHDVKGFGLGLSYVKAVVDLHKGSIKVSSKIGEGTTFCIFLPKNMNEIQ